MKAVLCTHFGTADELELGDIAEPQAGVRRSRGADQGRGV